MRSVADELKLEAREEIQALSLERRIALAFELSDADLETFRGARGCSREEALRHLQRQRQLQRPEPSGAMLEVIG